MNNKFAYILLILLVFVNANNGYAQKTYKCINYYFGDSVNYEIQKHINTENLNNYYCYYRSYNNDVKRIYISEFNNVDMYRKFAKKNTRYLIVNKAKIPIIFDSDDSFAIELNTTKKMNYGPDIIKKQTKSGGGFFVDFKQDSNFETVILNVGFEQ